MVFCVGITSYFVSERDDANGRKRFFFRGGRGIGYEKTQWCVLQDFPLRNPLATFFPKNDRIAVWEASNARTSYQGLKKIGRVPLGSALNFLWFLLPCSHHRMAQERASWWQTIMQIHCSLSHHHHHHHHHHDHHHHDHHHISLTERKQIVF